MLAGVLHSFTFPDTSLQIFLLNGMQLLYITFDLAQPLFSSFFGSELQNDIAPSILHGLP
jgi:hypothetical protein